MFLKVRKNLLENYVQSIWKQNVENREAEVKRILAFEVWHYV